MSMVRHQTPRKNVDVEAVQFLRHEIEVRLAIAISLENGNGSYTALSDMMWYPAATTLEIRAMRET